MKTEKQLFRSRESEDDKISALYTDASVGFICPSPVSTRQLSSLDIFKLFKQKQTERMRHFSKGNDLPILLSTFRKT